MTPSCIHPIKITFTIPLAPTQTVERCVYAYVLDGDPTLLIDTGVAGSEAAIATALRRLGKTLAQVRAIVLTHAHPDHIGAAHTIVSRYGTPVWAHADDRAWIENTQRQERERPVPGFGQLVAGPVRVTRLLRDGSTLDAGDSGTLTVLHTPGHSAGSVSLLSERDGVLFSGDVVPQPGGMPVYEDVAALAASLARLSGIGNLTALYSSWTAPQFGPAAGEAVQAGIRYLKAVHAVVTQVDAATPGLDAMELCRQCVPKLGLPPFAANPLVARSLLAHRAPGAREALAALA